VSPELHFWPTPLQAFCLGDKPKAKVVTNIIFFFSPLILCLPLYICLLLCYLSLLLPTFIYFYFCFFAFTFVQCLLMTLFSFVCLYLDSFYVCY